MSNYEQRLHKIVSQGFDCLREKINGGRLKVDNEASLQLHLGAILNTLGSLHEYRRDEMFSIELEKNVTVNGDGLKKSGTSRAKIDIFLALGNVDGVNAEARSTCAIELKYFQRKNQREPNNRYDLFRDLCNLEDYGSIADLGYMIIGTDHAHYVTQEKYSTDTADFDFRQGRKYSAGTSMTYRTPKPYGEPIVLRNDYAFHWEEAAHGTHFMKIEVPPVRR